MKNKIPYQTGAKLSQNNNVSNPKSVIANGNSTITQEPQILPDAS